MANLSAVFMQSDGFRDYDLMSLSEASMRHFDFAQGPQARSLSGAETNIWGTIFLNLTTLDYDSVTVKVKDCYLKQIYPNSVSSSVTIEYKTKNVGSAYLIVTRPYSGISNNYILDLNQTQKTINLSALPN